MPFLPCEVDNLSAHFLGALSDVQFVPRNYRVLLWEGILHLFPPDGLVCCTNDGVFDAVNVEARAIEGVRVCEAVEEDLHFFRANLEGHQLVSRL